MGNRRAIHLYTIGFTRKTAEQFFGKLKQAGVKRVIDVRIHNVSQLAGFAKKDDLEYFLRELANIEYMHLPILAPTEEMMKSYRAGKGNWDAYARKFTRLIRSRKIEEQVSPELLDGACLLCSEDTPDECHRRLVAEYLMEAWGDIDVQITHLA